MLRHLVVRLWPTVQDSEFVNRGQWSIAELVAEIKNVRTDIAAGGMCPRKAI